ncbi:MAG: ATP-binding protein [Mariniphaga sp.]
MVSTVLRNLVSNAIKFTNRNGTIQLKALRQNNKVQITVSDSGIGIDEARKNNLFGINEKMVTSGTENEPGTGLGLVLCKEFITKHNEKIWIESQIGKGSDFIFTLPLSMAEKL